jgi:hypothetical protein
LQVIDNHLIRTPITPGQCIASLIAYIVNLYYRSGKPITPGVYTVYRSSKPNSLTLIMIKSELDISNGKVKGRYRGVKFLVWRIAVEKVCVKTLQ